MALLTSGLRLSRCSRVCILERVNPTVLDLSFNRFIGLQGADEPHLLRLPASERYLNHIGTVHASALVALAEASSGEFLPRHRGQRVAAPAHRPEGQSASAHRGAQVDEPPSAGGR